MVNSISLTIPIEESALMRSASLLLNMAEDLKFKADTGHRGPPLKDENIKEPAPADIVDPVCWSAEKSPTEVFSENTIVDAPVPIADGILPGSPVETAITPNTAKIFGVEIDSAGLPWDDRIHASSKAFLSKGGGWKKKRGVDPAIVAQVEAELKTTLMPVPTNTAPAPVEILPAPPATSEITTFAQLMSEITSNQLDPDTVLTVVQKHGLTGMGLLAARPDLIPVIAKELGL